MIILGVILFFCVICWKWYTRRSPDEPPMLPKALPLIGHAHLILGDTQNFWRFIKNTTHQTMEMGHASFFYTGPFKFYVLTDPDDVYTVSNTCFQKDSFSYEFTKSLLGDGLLFSPAHVWKRHRKLISPAFNQQILDGFLVVFNKQGRKIVDSMTVEVGKEPFDHSFYVRQNFMETICLTALAADGISQEESLSYVKSFESYLNYSILRFQTFWLHSDLLYNFSALKKKQDKVSKVLHGMSDAVLRKKRAERKMKDYTEPSSETNGQKMKVFMDLMLDLDEGTLSDREIRDELNTIIMAGHDTSANVSVFAMLLIGSYPKVQEKIYQELQEVFGDSDRDVEKQDLSKLVYMEAVLKETMRYYVMAPFVGRFIDREVKLKNCTLKPGNNCLFMLYGIHRNPVWGPDVNEFRPERWLSPDTLPKNPNTFVGFSLGKRNCIGKAYAMMSMKTMFSYILRRYRIHADNSNLVLKLDVLLKPVSGHLVTLEDRLKS